MSIADSSQIRPFPVIKLKINTPKNANSDRVQWDLIRPQLLIFQELTTQMDLQVAKSLESYTQRLIQLESVVSQFKSQVVSMLEQIAVLEKLHGTKRTMHINDVLLTQESYFR